MTKTALIIGLSSQDGSYLADLLLHKNYRVVGTIRRSTSIVRENIRHLYGRVQIAAADLLDPESLNALVEASQPDEIYNFGAQSVPADSWSQPLYTAHTTGVGVVSLLEAARRFAPRARIYQATSREIYGGLTADFANESTPLSANNPYGAAKAYAHMMVKCYRDSYGLFVVSGIAFNHESPRRSLHFVTRKISASVACLKNRVNEPPLDESGRLLVADDGKLHLGRLDARRDWGYAPEFVDAMWRMLQRDEPQDYIIATGTSFSVQDACRMAFEHVGMDWEDWVAPDQALMRPTEIGVLSGDYQKAHEELGWEPHTKLPELMRLMVDADLQRFRQ
jgi:GDPmannose 4,6-dehydratase